MHPPYTSSPAVPSHPPAVTKSKCPYTLAALTGAGNLNDEHVFPEALGGTREFAFRADAQKNAWLGSNVDAPLINSPLTKMLLVQYGIEPGGREAKAVLPGTIDGTDVHAEATLRPGGVVETYVREKFVYATDPATGATDRNRGTIYETADKMPELLQAFLAKSRPGKEVCLEPEESLGTPTLRTALTLNQPEVRRGIAKIAFGTAFFFLGDAYLDDPMVREWHKLLFAPNVQEADMSRLGFLPFRHIEDYRLVLPPIAGHEHAASVVRVGAKQIVASVGLFGARWPYTAAIIASVTDTYGLAEGDGFTVICDTLGRACRFEPFAPYFEAEANRRARMPTDDPRALPPLNAGNRIANSLCERTGATSTAFCHDRVVGEPIALVEREQFERTQRIAYDLWERRGRPFGDDQQDWFAAEASLLAPPAGPP